MYKKYLHNPENFLGMWWKDEERAYRIIDSLNGIIDATNKQTDKKEAIDYRDEVLEQMWRRY